MTIEAHKKIRRLERVAGTARSIEHEHAKVHDGLAFSFTSQISLAGGGKHVVAYTNPASEAYHLTTARIEPSGGPVVAKLYEAPFLNANSMGTETILKNRYRPATTVASLQMHLDPFTDANSLGTLLEAILIPATNQSVGESADFPFEWVFDLGTQYIVEIHNQNASAIQLMYTPFIYETGVV